MRFIVLGLMLLCFFLPTAISRSTIGNAKLVGGLAPPRSAGRLVEGTSQVFAVAEQETTLDWVSDEIWCEIGESYLAKPQILGLDARELFRQAIALNPNSARAHVGLGWAHLNRAHSGLVVYREDMDAWRKAEACFTRAAKLAPQKVEAYLGRAQALVSLGRYEEAIRDYEHVLALEPLCLDSYRGLGRIYESLGQLTDAEVARKQIADAMLLRQTRLDSQGGCPETLSSSKRSDEDEAFFDNYAFGNLMEKMTKFDEAIEAFRLAVELRPDEPNAIFRLARAYLAAGDAARAEVQRVLLLRLAEDAGDPFTRDVCRRLAKQIPEVRPFR